MPCKHIEEVCQHCLQKVQREDSSEEEVSSPPPKRVVPRPMAPKKSKTEKANEIFFGTSVLALVGYVAFWNVKFFFETVDFGACVAKDIFKNLVD